MHIEIRQVTPGEAPIELLLDADPSREKLNAYVPRSHCFIACAGDETVGACVLQPHTRELYELMSIAVAPAYQRQGIGEVMLRHAIDAARMLGARRIEVGTGSFGYQLTFYQKAGFRVCAIERDFFVKNYPEPIYENGIHLKDMLRLAIEFDPPPTP